MITSYSKPDCIPPSLLNVELKGEKFKTLRFTAYFVLHTTHTTRLRRRAKCAAPVDLGGWTVYSLKITCDNECVY